MDLGTVRFKADDQEVVVKNRNGKRVISKQLPFSIKQDFVRQTGTPKMERDNAPAQDDGHARGGWDGGDTCREVCRGVQQEERRRRGRCN